ncbi:SDR family oxidoreductase [Paracrocinitomix mangrovi]|uniref:SDR family oxidoreductase n=1 Tax=Paracrocinitomix mangrovi TaxID=2862509 RepID=UPI001C8D2F30|nr:SDR family oxidoreductase [Paracrocinitomix mangrovi]UKN01376.1 SDR family oxidoreductase [Paracrocinitomix mangrovi]
MKKTILLIGSSGGLGTALTKHFGMQEYNLALHYLDNPPSEIPANAKTYKADIKKEDEIENMIQQVVKDFGSIDILINNAGISKSEISWKTSAENWNDTIAVNLTGPFLATKHALPYMRDKQFGRIIFMSSIVAQTGFVGAAAYGASKAGLIGLTKSLAKEISNKNITVNSIALGYFNAGMINDVPDEMQEELIDKIPVSKLGDPSELAALMDYIISDKATYLTGQTLNLNGGLYS